MKCNESGKDIIRQNEGLRLQAYICPSGIPTIGYGHTEGVKLGQKITEHQADVILDLDLEHFEKGVEGLGLTLNENEFSALVSFAFNIGLHALGASTLVKKFRAGDKNGAAFEFSKWVRGSTGAILPGLVKRRELERDLFLRQG